MVHSRIIYAFTITFQPIGHCMLTISANSTLVALDFETADYKPDSACAIGMSKIQHGNIVDSYYTLIKPPRKRVYFTEIHNIRWEDVQFSPTFAEVWADIATFIQDATHLVAHNASFDKRVLHACCLANTIAPPLQPFICTVQASRKILRLPSHKLDAVCQHFNITLNHHHAGSDAEASAHILLKLLELTKPHCWQQ